MLYYSVAKAGSGTIDDPFRPNLPSGVSWVGQDCGDGTFLVAMDAAVSGLTPLTDSEVQNICTANGISFAEVTGKWNVV